MIVAIVAGAYLPVAGVAVLIGRMIAAGDRGRPRYSGLHRNGLDTPRPHRVH